MNGNTYFNFRFYIILCVFCGSKLGSPVTSGVTRRHSRVYFVDCEGIFTPILRTCVRKSTLLLQNRGHAEVLKKDPFFREIRNKGSPPPRGGGFSSVFFYLKKVFHNKLY